MLLLHLGGLLDLLGFVGPLVPPAAAAGAAAATAIGGYLAGWARNHMGKTYGGWNNTRPPRLPKEAPDEGEYTQAMPYQLSAVYDSYVPFTKHKYCVGSGIWSEGGLNVNPSPRGWDGIIGHRWKGIVTAVTYQCAVSGQPNQINSGETEVGIWIKSKDGNWSRATGGKVWANKILNTFYQGQTYENQLYRPTKINGLDIDWGTKDPPEGFKPQPLPPLITDPSPARRPDQAPETQPELDPIRPSVPKPAPPMTPTPAPPEQPTGPDTPAKPDPPIIRPWPDGNPTPAPPGPAPPGSKPGVGTGVGTGTGTGTGSKPAQAPALTPDGVQKPDPKPIPPVPDWLEDFWGEAIGQPEARPQPTLEGIARETGKLEQKLRIIGNPSRPLPGLPDGLPELAGKLLDILMSIDGGGEYTLSSPCQTNPDGSPADPVVVSLPPSVGWNANVVKRIDALAELIQAHKDLKQPVCLSHAAQGEPVTVHFISADIPPGSNRRLRKVFGYRDQTNASLEAHADHWRSFRWQAGPVQVILRGTPLGAPQVWASSEAEGRRVIRHAAAIAGVDIPADAAWSANSPRGGRMGQPGTMKVALDGQGALAVTKRAGSSGLPEVVV